MNEMIEQKILFTFSVIIDKIEQGVFPKAAFEAILDEVDSPCQRFIVSKKYQNIFTISCVIPYSFINKFDHLFQLCNYKLPRFVQDDGTTIKFEPDFFTSIVEEKYDVDLVERMDQLGEEILSDNYAMELLECIEKQEKAASDAIRNARIAKIERIQEKIKLQEKMPATTNRWLLKRFNKS